jgi:serine/threonine protein kinase
MAEVISFGEPENESERMAIVYLRAHLPASYKLFTNLEIKQGLETFEIDLILLAPHCVYVVDVKNWHGRIDISTPKWYPDNYQSYPSPLKKLRKHAKVLSSTICDTNRAMQHELSKVHIQATVLMTADDVQVIDQSSTEGDYVTYLDKRCLAYFQSNAYIPEQRHRNIKTLLPNVERAIRGKSRPKTAPPRYRDWQVEEGLGGNDRYTEYRARNLMMGVSGWTARLRVYKIDPFLEAAEREAEYKLIGTAFQAVRQLPPDPNILSVQEFFVSHDHDCLVLVTEDIPGQVLRQHIKKQNQTLDWKFAIIRDVLHALEHVHKHGVIHRNITPDSILISAEGQARLVGFDYARVRNRTSTIAEDIADDLEEYAAYQAIECQKDPSQASITSDLFSAGLVFYELLIGLPAFADANQIYEWNAIFPIKPSERNPELTPELDRWLQKLCAFEPKDRFPNADAALQELTLLATLPKLDITNLPPDTIIDDRFRVIRRLGRPGSFAVAYKVFDTLGGVVRVLKLVTRDRRSVYERLQQEYKILLQVPKHPHVVDVVWAGHLKDDTPFIVFEYVNGQDVEHLIESKISLEQAVQIAQQTAIGLNHLHKHKVSHQDIKPSNLLLTNQGVRIIDFNVAVSESDEMNISAGTLRYIPPDCKPSLNKSPTEKIDRDLYALGITFYECVTGRYPFDEPQPPIGKPPHDPTEIEGCEDLSQELVQLLIKAIAPKRAERFTSAAEFLESITSLPSLRKAVEQPLPLTTDEHEAQSQETPEPIVFEIETTEPSKATQVLPPVTPIPEWQQPQLITKPLQPVISETGKARFNLFDAPLPTSHQPNPDKPIVLDRTELYDIPPGYVPITTEVEWMQSFGMSTSPYWVKGKRLCDWAVEWLRVWDKTEVIAEIKQNPDVKLAALFDPVPVPDEWTKEQLLTLATRLNSYPQDNPIAHLLADITDDHQIWLAEPSIENLAAWLAIQVPQECRILERVWQHQFNEHNLATYYQNEDKLLLLRRWLRIAEPVITELDKYPLPVPDFLTAEFDQYWEQQLYRTETKVLEHLIPTNQPGMERIAELAYKVLSHRPNWITKVRETKLSAYLSHQQKVDLGDRQPPPQPQPLALDASPKQALT